MRFLKHGVRAQLQAGAQKKPVLERTGRRASSSLQPSDHGHHGTRKTPRTRRAGMMRVMVEVALHGMNTVAARATGVKVSQAWGDLATGSLGNNFTHLAGPCEHRINSCCNSTIRSGSGGLSTHAVSRNSYGSRRSNRFWRVRRW